MLLSDQVLTYLKTNARGRLRAANAGDIAAALNASERAVRAAVHDLRNAGEPIASAVEEPTGFYIPRSVEEAEACSGHLWARVREIARVARRFDDSVAVLGLKRGYLKQLRLFQEERQVYRDVG
jgi:hypothetical protein